MEYNLCVKKTPLSDGEIHTDPLDCSSSEFPRNIFVDSTKEGSENVEITDENINVWLINPTNLTFDKKERFFLSFFKTTDERFLSTNFYLSISIVLKGIDPTNLFVGKNSELHFSLPKIKVLFPIYLDEGKYTSSIIERSLPARAITQSGDISLASQIFSGNQETNYLSLEFFDIYKGVMIKLVPPRDFRMCLEIFQ